MVPISFPNMRNYPTHDPTMYTYFITQQYMCNEFVYTYIYIIYIYTYCIVSHVSNDMHT